MKATCLLALFISASLADTPFYCRPITPVIHTTVQTVHHRDGGHTVFYTHFNASGVVVGQQSVYTIPERPVAPVKAAGFSWDRFASGKPWKRD